MRAPHIRLLALLLSAGLLGGCAMKRFVTIDSDPTGADIWVNGDRMATKTPVTVPFTHYGRFDVRLEKAGYRSVASEVMVETQIDGYPVVDLPFEILGGTRHVHKVVRMEPLGLAKDPAGLEEILRKARALRQQTHDAVAEPGTPGRQAPEIVK